MPASITFRDATAADSADVSALARRVFDAHVAQGYSPDGREAYYRFSSAEAMDARVADNRVVVAVGEPDGRIVGMLEVRGRTHVSMLFIESGLQRAGVGRGLLGAAFGPPSEWPTLTVNSAPGAVGAYLALGFVPVEDEREVNGIRFVAMRRPGREREASSGAM